MAEPVAFKYCAFLSYAHADVRWGQWLHRQLESYRIDKDLVGLDSPVGPVPKSLRVFRDREDFSGGHTLNDATIAALDASAALIVVCSPIAATRPAVNEEVRLFRSRNPDRRVIPVIIDGTFPHNFPAALRFELGDDAPATERLITILGPDLRDAGDGKALGLAKIVAGLIGVDTDVIVRRSERAARRRMRHWVAGLAVVVVGLMGLAGWAEVNRREAVAQRTRAYAAKLATEAQFALTDVLSPAAPAVTRALASLALSESAEAKAALALGIQRLPPFALGALPLVPEDGVPTRLKFGPRGDFLLGIGESAVWLWNARSRQLVARHRLDGTASLMGFSTDGEWAALRISRKGSSGELNRLLLLGTGSGAVIERSYTRLLDAAATDEGWRVLAADPDGIRLQVSDPISNATLRELTLNAGVSIARLRPRDGALLVADRAGKAWLSPPGLQEQATQFAIPSGATPVAMAAQAGLIALQTSTRGLAIAEMATGRLVVEIPEGGGEGLEFLAGDQFFAVAGRHGRDFYSVKLKKRIVAGIAAMSRHEDPTRRTDIGDRPVEVGASNDGRLIFTAYDDGRVSVSTLGVAPTMLPGTAPAPEMAEVARFQHGNTLGATALISVNPGQALFIASSGRYAASQSSGIKTTVNGLVASQTRLLRVWDIYTGEEVARLHPRNDMLVEFEPQGGVFATLTASGSHDDPARLEMWRLMPGSEAPMRSVAELPELSGAERHPASTVVAMSASADGAQRVWLTLDQKLHVRDQQTGEPRVIDDLRPALQRAWAEVSVAWPAKLHSIDPSISLEAVVNGNPAIRFLRMASTREPMPESIRTGLVPSILGMEHSMTFPLAVSGNGCCAVLALGPLVRLYDIATGRLMAERTLSDMAPHLPPDLPGHRLLVSYDGRAYAVEIDTWESFGRAARAADSSEQGPPRTHRKMLAFRADSPAPTGTVETDFLGGLRLTWPLAVDSSGGLMALRQIKFASASDQTAGIAVLRTADGKTVFETPASRIDLLSGDLDFLSNMASFRGAFSSDDRHLAIALTRAACPSVATMLSTWTVARAPICSAKRASMEVWQLDSGRQAATASFEFSPEPPQPAPGSALSPALPLPSRSVLGLAMLDGKTMVQTVIEAATTARRGELRLVTERIRLDGPRTVENACARLPRSNGMLQRDAWEQALPGEPYRSVCP